MRLIQLAIPNDIVPAIETALDDEELDYYCAPESDRNKYDTIINFVVETPDVEPILDRLYEAGLSSTDHGIIVDVETDLFKEIERNHESESKVGHHARIADAELRTEADNQIMDPYSYVQMTVLSALVATVGLILDSAAVIIGAMVIAPLLGPALSSTVGTVLDDQDLFWKGVATRLGASLSLSRARQCSHGGSESPRSLHRGWPSLIRPRSPSDYRPTFFRSFSRSRRGLQAS